MSRALDRIDDIADIGVTGAAHSDEFGQHLLNIDQPIRFSARITSAPREGGLYSGEEVTRDPGATTWTATGNRVFDLDNFPLAERNADMNVPIGTIVEAVLNETDSRGDFTATPQGFWAMLMPVPQIEPGQDDPYGTALYTTRDLRSGIPSPSAPSESAWQNRYGCVRLVRSPADDGDLPYKPADRRYWFAAELGFTPSDIYFPTDAAAHPRLAREANGKVAPWGSVVFMRRDGGGLVFEYTEEVINAELIGETAAANALASGLPGAIRYSWEERFQADGSTDASDNGSSFGNFITPAYEADPPHAPEWARSGDNAVNVSGAFSRTSLCQPLPVRNYNTSPSGDAHEDRVTFGAVVQLRKGLSFWPVFAFAQPREPGVTGALWGTPDDTRDVYLLISAKSGNARLKIDDVWTDLFAWTANATYPNGDTSSDMLATVQGAIDLALVAAGKTYTCQVSVATSGVQAFGDYYLEFFDADDNQIDPPPVLVDFGALIGEEEYWFAQPGRRVNFNVYVRPFDKKWFVNDADLIVTDDPFNTDEFAGIIDPPQVGRRVEVVSTLGGSFVTVIRASFTGAAHDISLKGRFRFTVLGVPDGVGGAQWALESLWQPVSAGCLAVGDEDGAPWGLLRDGPALPTSDGDFLLHSESGVLTFVPDSD